MAFKLNGFTYPFPTANIRFIFKTATFLVPNTYLPKPLFRLYFFVPQGTSANCQSTLLTQIGH